jgi:hypothetical protein
LKHSSTISNKKESAEKKTLVAVLEKIIRILKSRGLPFRFFLSKLELVEKVEVLAGQADFLSKLIH